MKKIGVVLGGCGVYDGSEIHEAVITLLAIARNGAQAVCFAPDKPQRDVINHLTGEAMPEQRNVLVEAARIARGDILPLAQAREETLDALIVPGGFGGRGIEGMILAAKYARENNVPYFGICLGMQIAVIEYARDVAGIKDAHSGEFDELCKNKVIDFMPGQSDNIDKGGTLRLGAYPCVIKPGTTMERCYGKSEISERHRHRYE